MHSFLVTRRGDRAVIFCLLLQACASDELGSAGSGGQVLAGGEGGASASGGSGAQGGEAAASGSGGKDDAGEGGSAGGKGGGSGEGGAAGGGTSGGMAGEGGSGGAGAAGGMGGEGGSGDALRFTVLPKLEMSGDNRTPLWAELTLATNRKTSVQVTTTTSTRAWTHAFSTVAAEHVHTLLRFLPDTTHLVEVTVQDESGEALTYAEKLEARTPALPGNFPEFSVTVSNSSEMEPGVILMGVPADPVAGGAYIVVLEKTGDVVWFHYTPKGTFDLRRLASGNPMWIAGNRREILEIDMRGALVRSFVARGPALYESMPASTCQSRLAGSEPVEVATDFFHHEQQELDSGNLLTLTTEVRSLPDYPTSELDPTPRAEPLNVVGDAVIEFSPDGGIVNRWPLMDLLDPYRVGWGSFGNFWQDHYGDPTVTDWAHANSVIFDPRDGNLIVSLRHQDAVVKFTPAGELVWILSDPANWKEPFSRYLLKPKVGDFAWPYHQHAPKIAKSGALLLFDNGNERASPPDTGLPEAERYSRVVEFEIDADTLEVSTRWQYGSTEAGPNHFYAYWMGDVDELPTTGNVLVTIADTLTPPPEGERSPIIREVTHADPADVVFEVRIDDNESEVDPPRSIYRVDHLPDIYVK